MAFTPPPVQQHVDPHHRQDCTASPHREIHHPIGSPSLRHEDDPPPDSGGRDGESRPARDSQLEPAGGFFYLEPVSNRWEVSVCPAALGCESPLAPGLNVTTSWSMFKVQRINGDYFDHWRSPSFHTPKTLAVVVQCRGWRDRFWPREGDKGLMLQPLLFHYFFFWTYTAVSLITFLRISALEMPVIMSKVSEQFYSKTKLLIGVFHWLHQVLNPLSDL